MCGINGFSMLTLCGNMEDRIKKMNKSLAHRGPNSDGFHVFHDRGVAIGHRRLSIIDLQERANQPMFSASGEWAIVFNGEIYNFNELKSKTEYPYSTMSDTEVILAYVQQYGLETFLCDCNGMFAFCLYNVYQNRMYLVRDRLGIKPLYYTLNQQGFVFSSEIKGILNSGLVDAVLFEDAIDEYLGNRYVRAPYTFFENIYQLEPGCMLSIDCTSDVIKKTRYWRLPEQFNQDKDYDENEVLEAFSAEVKQAVERRLISDVPLGTYLSGGVDSSLITAITAAKSNFRVNSYTIGFSEMNEFLYARMVAEWCGTNHHEILMNIDDYFKTMEEIIAYKDSPLGVPNEIPLAIMSRELKKNITVVLSGEGADELMGGYGRIFRSPFDYENHIQVRGQSFQDYFIGLYEYVPRSIRNQYLKTGIGLREKFDRQIKDIFDDHKNNENVFRYFHTYHVQGLLQRVDVTTMLASVEARVPFLDHKLVEFSYKQVPYELKLHWKNAEVIEQIRKRGLCSSAYSEIYDVPKYLLRKMAFRYLPREVIERKKVGFPVPLNQWQQKIEGISRNLLEKAPWLCGEELDSLIENCAVNPRSGQILWMFISFEMFRQMYFLKQWRY